MTASKIFQYEKTAQHTRRHPRQRPWRRTFNY